jgi:hypothetical protein
VLAGPDHQREAEQCHTRERDRDYVLELVHATMLGDSAQRRLKNVQENSENWRIEVDLPDEEHHASFLSHLMDGEAQELEGDFQRAFHERLVVTRDDSTVFLYPHDEQQARRAESAVQAVLDAHGWKGQVAVTRWHDAEERWEPASTPLPATPEEERAEHAGLVESERAQTATERHYAFDVLVTLPHHRQAHDLYEGLLREGLPVTQRWRYLVVGATDEDQAAELEARIRAEAPDGTTATTFTRENLHEAVGYVSEVSADNPFVIPPHLPGLR